MAGPATAVIYYDSNRIDSLTINSDTPSIVTVGEILWDMFPSGPRFGGAPANLAHHAAALGGNVAIVSSVGSDDLGATALRLLAESSIDTSYVTVNDQYPTGKVNVEIDAGGHASYRFNSEEAWDHIPWTSPLRELAMRADAVCFGTLAQRHSESHDTIHSFVMATRPTALRVLDLNLRVPHYDERVIHSSLKLANVLKLNEEELELLANIYGCDSGELAQARKIMQLFKLQTIAITRGARGSLILHGDEISEVPAEPVKVQDTVGAGDSYTAAIVTGLLKSLPLDELNRAACRIAEYVCTQPGATPKLPANLAGQCQGQ